MLSTTRLSGWFVLGILATVACGSESASSGGGDGGLTFPLGGDGGTQDSGGGATFGPGVAGDGGGSSKTADAAASNEPGRPPGPAGTADASARTDGAVRDAGPSNGGADAGGGTTGPGGTLPIDVLKGYWVWESRVMGTTVQPKAPLDAGQMKIAFGTGNNKCHYIWNETTRSDFHTECTYTVSEGNLVTYTAKADPDKTAAGYSCAHPDWTSWNDRPAIEWGRFKFVGDRLWLGVNAYWGGANGQNGSCKRFPFWESKGQAVSEEAWIVFKPVTRAEWYQKYAISTNCQGSAALCAQLPGCGPGDKGYVD